MNMIWLRCVASSLLPNQFFACFVISPQPTMKAWSISTVFPVTSQRITGLFRGAPDVKRGFLAPKLFSKRQT